MLVSRALNNGDQKLLALMVKRVGVALRLQRNNGIVCSTNGPGQYMLWEVERSAICLFRIARFLANFL